MSKNYTYNNEKKVLKVLNGQTLFPPPIWLMRQAGRYLPEYRKLRSKASSFLDLCYNSNLASEVTLQPIKRFDFDAAIIFADILLICQAMGQSLEFKEGVGPILDPVKDKYDLNKLSISITDTKLENVFQTILKTRKKLASSKTLIGFAGSPWTVVVYMIEGKSGTKFDTIKKISVKNPSFIDSLIELVVEVTSIYLKKQIQAGVDVIQLFDSWSGLLEEENFKRWSILPTVKIVDNIRETYPRIPIIGFPRCAGKNVFEYANNTKVNCIGLDQNFLFNDLNMFKDTIALQGNLSPTILKEGGDRMESNIENIVYSLKSRPHIFNLGHGILPDTPIENVQRMLSFIRRLK